MNAIATLTQGHKLLYLYPDGTMLPIVAGGDEVDDYFLKQGKSTTGPSKSYGGGYNTVDSWEDLNSAVDDWKLKSLVEILRDLSLSGSIISDRFYKSLQNSLLITEAAGIGSVAELSQTPQIGDFLQRLQKAGNSVRDAIDLGPDSPATRNYMAELQAQNAFEAAEAEKNRAFQAQQAEMDREIQRQNQARQEREARLNALLDNIRYLNEIQPDNFRLGIGLNSLNNKSVTPTIAYGNQLQGNINQLQSGGPLPQPAIIPAQGMANTGMAQGGSISMAPSPGVQMGSTRRGVLVGDREINGDEELLVFDVAKPGNIEVIPIMGRAAEGATFNVGQTTPDPQSSYGIFSSIYHPFGITSAGMVPTRATAKRTDLGYIEPRFNTDFAPVAAPAYGAMSEQYFDRLTGMLLPNISTIMPTLRALQYDNPAIFAEVLNAYENATNQAGQPSPLPKEAILGMLDNSALSGRAAGYIGVR